MKHSQRSVFSELLFKEMEHNPSIFLLTGDLGYKVFDRYFDVFNDRCINVGASEQSMLDIAVGLAHSEKIPVCYSITPFLIYRGFETLRTYINYESIPVKLVGSGRNRDYKEDGISHWGDDVSLFLNQLQNIQQFYPLSESDITTQFSQFIYGDSPAFISLQR